MPLPIIPLVVAAGSAIYSAIKNSGGRQLSQQEKLQNLQIEGQKEMTDYNAEKQYDMWQKTGPVGQMEQYTKAGLNPGLIYGMSGGGGQTANITSGNVTGGTAAQPKQTAPEDTIGMGIQLAMAQSQKELMNAQTEKIKAETEKTKGVDTAEGVTRMMSLNQGIQNAQAQKTLTEIQTELAKLEQQFGHNTMTDRVATVGVSLAKIQSEVQVLNNNAEISDETKQDKIKQIKEEAIQAALKNTLTEEQIKQIKEGIQQGWTDLQIKDFISKTNVQQKDQDQILGIIHTIMNIAGKLVPAAHIMK